jgi:hypothetical protein
MIAMRKLAFVAGLLYVVWFTAFIAMPAVVDAMIQSADAIGSHQRIAQTDSESH